MRRVVPAFVVSCLFLGACGDGTDTPAATPTDLATETAAPATVGAPTESPPSSGPVTLGYEIVRSFPHDTDAFTQGLLVDDEGRLFEATGYDSADPDTSTTLRELDPATGDVLRSVDLGRQVFGEGLAVVGDELVQLTWTDEIAYVWDADTLEQTGTFTYDGEGWGLCRNDDGNLVMSNGSAELTERDPATFAPTDSVSVTLDGASLDRLNELECVGGDVWANVWLTDQIVRIDGATGAVTGVLDLAGLIDPHPATANGNAVLNGIAHLPASDTFLITGKLWPTVFEIRVVEPTA